MNQLELRVLSLEKLTNEQAGYNSQLKEDLSSIQKCIKDLYGRIEVLEKTVSMPSHTKTQKATKSEK